ncbi:MAG: hypothetical protein R2867_24685 [Caldilineaceae bacterium]
MAFALDRIRVTFVRVGGRWTQQFLTYFLLGLTLWVGFTNSTTYYTFALRQVDPISALGYWLRALPTDQAVIVHAAPDSLFAVATLENNLSLRFLLNGELPFGPLYRDVTNPAPDMALQQAATIGHVLAVEEIPALIPPDTVVVLPVEDVSSLAQLKMAYPAGVLTVARDINATPLLYLYTVQ